MTTEMTPGTNDPVTPPENSAPDVDPSLLTPGEPAEGDPKPAEADPESPWYSGLPESTHELMKGYENPEQVTEALQAHKERTADIPEDPSGYKIPEGLPTSEKDMGTFVKAAHDLGLTQKQVEGLANWQKEANAEYSKAMNQQSENWKQSVLKEWGDDTEANTELALRGVRDFASEDLQKILGETGFGNHPAVVAHFLNLGKVSAEGRAPASDNTPGDPDVARTETGQPMLNFNMGN